MDPRDAANRDLLFGLLALQNGLVDQDALVAAFRAWTRDKARPIAEILAAQGAIDADDRALLEGLAAKHLKRHGGDAEQSLAALERRPLDPRGPRRDRRPRHRGHPRPRRLAARPSRATADPTGPATYVASAPRPPTAGGSASCGPTPGAAWARSSWPSTTSCTARSR